MEGEGGSGDAAIGGGFSGVGGGVGGCILIMGCCVGVSAERVVVLIGFWVSVHVVSVVECVQREFSELL